MLILDNQIAAQEGGTFAVLASVLVLFPMIAYGAAVDLAWDPNTESDLAGYKIHYGTASGAYSHSVDVGSEEAAAGRNPACGAPYDPFKTACCEYKLELAPGTYYLSATAYDEDENESAYSEELVHTIAIPNHNPTTPSIPDSHSSGYTQTNYTFSTTASDPDGDALQYRFDWGGGDFSDWGAASQNHSWSSAGDFCVKAQAKDSKGALSSWSDCKIISIIEKTYTIAASAGANGSISPSGIVVVSYGMNRTFAITAGTNYHVEDVRVNGVSVGAVTSYTFTNVTRNHTIQASFAINTHTITATAGANGSISPSGTVMVNHGSSRTFTISAGTNYHVEDVRVNGVSVGAVTSYTFTNVTRGHEIQASFAINSHTIMATAGANGNISPSGDITVNHGSSRTFTISAATNYHVQDVLVNGDSVGAVTSYTFTNVTRSHEIQASFAIDKHSPVADAGANQAVYVSDMVHLDGSSSSDVDGDELNFKWSFISKPDGSSAVLSNTTAVNPTFVVDVAGSYIVQLIVNDGTTDSQPDTVIISTENSPPAADAGANQAVYVSDMVHLDGSSSSDVDGDELNFKWSFISKPDGSSAVLSNTTAVNPTFVVDVAGSYIVQLIVNDGTADSQPDRVIISTENSPPVAEAGADQAVWVTDTVHLDGSSSNDADGDALSFKWSFTSKPDGSSADLSNAAEVNPTFVVDVAGSYIVQLIVNDGTNDSQPDTVIISTENSAPVAEAGTDQAVYVSDRVHLDGSSSNDADGDALSFKWSFTSKPEGSSAALSNATAVNPTFVVDVAGSYIAQLIVNDGSVDSHPDTVIISTESSSPTADAGEDQTVEEGDLVVLDGLNSTDPNGKITSCSWEQTGGTKVNLSHSDEAEATFTAPTVGTEPEMLTFKLTVIDEENLQDIDTCSVYVNKKPVTDSDADGVPDDEDDFPYDPDEWLDTDGDGEGNNADTDDDNDGMPDTWESKYGLDPLKDDAADDPDGDGVSNIDEYNLGTKPNKNEGNFEPYPPALIAPDDHETVSLTPELKTDKYYDPDINDVHSQTRWQIKRAEDENIVFDVNTDSSLTAMTVPKLILEYDTKYIWQVKFIDNHGGASDWSKPGYFTTEFSEEDSDGNGILDHQEVDDTVDLDKDGVADREQSDIKCIVAESGKAQIGVSIRNAENVDSILFMEIEEPDDNLILNSKGAKPRFVEFGLLHFKLLMNAPGQETVVTIHLSRAAFKKGNLYKYDPVNSEWLDYSDYADFSRNREKVYLTLKDGGFGDADGIENGIIVDPLAFGSDSDPNSGSDSFVENIGDSLKSGAGCFISAATTSRPSDRQALSLYREFRGAELSVVFILMVLGYVGTEIFLRLRQKRGVEAKRIARIAMGGKDET